MRKIIGLCIAVLAISGCSLGDVTEKGATCPPKDAEHEAGLGIIGGVECSETDCLVNDVDYTTNIQYGYCPVEFSQCGYDSAKDVYYCAKIACEEDEHIYEDECEPDTIRHCGSHEHDCKQLSGWKSGKCEDKQCVAEKCVEGYEVFKGKCKAQKINCEEGEHYYSEGSKCEKNTLENCGSHGNDCANLSGWDDGVCSTDGGCIAIACTTGYELKNGKCEALTGCPENQHLYSGACEEDSLENCGSHGTDCSKLSGWQSGNCVDGKCVPSACETGYALNNGKCEALTECPDDQHLFAGNCEPNDLENCGSHGTDCSKLSGWKAGDCTQGNCIPSECDAGYELRDSKCEALVDCPTDQHLYAGSCEPDSIQNCGAHANDCTLVAGWGGGECVRGNCSASACLTGYELRGDKCEALTECPPGQHLYSGSCEPDSLSHCGVHGNDCTSIDGWKSGNCENMKCVPTACKNGYCLDGNTCVNGKANDNACGILGGACVVCGQNKTCSSGQCTVTGCETGEHVYEGICEKDTISNCGSHGRECKIANAATDGVKCESTQCKLYNCKSGYHVYDNTCELDTTEHCGSHEKKCSIANASSQKCEGGQCKATTCDVYYHVWNGTCEYNDNDNCGAHGVGCSTSTVPGSSKVDKCLTGKCMALSCLSGYHRYDLGCEKNDNTNCGAHAKGCTTALIEHSESVQCSTSGVCELKNCKPYAKRVGETCKAICGTSDTYCPSDGGDMCCKRSSCTGQCIQAL